MLNLNIKAGPVKDKNVRLSMHGVALKVGDTWKSYNPATKSIVNVDKFTYDAGKFLFMLPVAHSAIAPGDLIITDNGDFKHVTGSRNDGTLSCVSVADGTKQNIMLTENMFGFNFATKVVSLFDSLGVNQGTPSPETPFGNMLPFMLMDSDSDMGPMVMAMMMGSMGQGTGNMQSMLPFLLMSKGGDMDPMVMAMMMGGMGNLGAAPTVDADGNPVAPAVPAMNPMLLMALMSKGDKTSHDDARYETRAPKSRTPRSYTDAE